MLLEFSGFGLGIRGDEGRTIGFTMDSQTPVTHGLLTLPTCGSFSFSCCPNRECKFLVSRSALVTVPPYDQS